MSETTQSLFDQYASMEDDDVRKLEIEHARNGLMRRHEVAYEDAEMQIATLRREEQNMLLAIQKNPVSGARSYDVNRRLNILRNIAELEAAKETLLSDFVTLFGEVMKHAPTATE